MSFRQTVAEKRDRDAPCGRRRVAANHDCAPLTALKPSGYLTPCYARFATPRARCVGRWREALFAFLSRNAQSATVYFRVPPNRVVELGAQVEL